ncbi:MAG: phosphate ABC transporter substrate-binding protein PstS family protein [Vulcanibacillus sp.]
MKKLVFILIAIALVFSVTACGNESSTETPTNTPETQPPVELEGTVSISGSTSVEKIGVATAEEFMALNPKVNVTYEGIGSSNGVKNANDGVTQIGTASRAIKESEKAWGLTEVVIAYDGVAVITHPSNSIEGLTLEEVQAIFKGEITNWSEVGGQPGEIVVVSREEGSGTRGAFEEIVKFEGELTDNATVVEGNGGVQTTVAQNPSSIGYVSFTYINDSVKPMLIDEVIPTTENVLNGTYSVSRPFVVIYHDKNMTDASKAYVDFVLSPAGQKIVEEGGGIPVK